MYYTKAALKFFASVLTLTFAVAMATNQQSWAVASSGLVGGMLITMLFTGWNKQEEAKIINPLKATSLMAGALLFGSMIFGAFNVGLIAAATLLIGCAVAICADYYDFSNERS